MPLEDIIFYQVYKRPKRRPKIKKKGRKWEVTKSTHFLERVKIIKQRAEVINEKLNSAK